MDMLSFVPEQLFILIISLNVLGKYLKDSKVSDNLIPTILLGVSVVSSSLLLKFNITSILQGIICWGVSIGIHQTVKQANK